MSVRGHQEGHLSQVSEYILDPSPLVSRRQRREDAIDRPPVAFLSRKEFIKLFAENYHAGQHFTLLGPSGRGKTKLCGQCLVATLRKHRDITARILHGKIKGRDQTIEKLSKQGFPITADTSPSRFQILMYRARRKNWEKPLGYIVRPLTRPEGSPDSNEDLTERENQHLRRIFRRVIYKSYHAPKKKPVILVIDEAHQAHVDLKLKKDCEGPLMRGRPVCAVWSLLQRGRYVSMHVYDQAEHVIIFFDPDRTNQERYSEIGGIDPQYLKELSRQLKTKTVADGSTISQALYFRRSGNYLAIVDF